MPLVYVLGQHRAHRGRPAPLPHQHGHDTGQQYRRNDRLRPHAVDAPHLNDVGLDIAKKRSAKEADARQFEHDAQPTHQGENSHQRVSCNADGRHRYMQRARLLVFGNGRKHGVAAMAYQAAIPMLRHRTRRRSVLVHKVDMERHRAYRHTCYCQQCNQILHGLHLTTAPLVNSPFFMHANTGLSLLHSEPRMRRNSRIIHVRHLHPCQLGCDYLPSPEVAMEVTLRELVTIVHGMLFGGFFLMAIGGAIVMLLEWSSPDAEASPSRAAARWRTTYLVAMVALGWAAVFSG